MLFRLRPSVRPLASSRILLNQPRPWRHFGDAVRPRPGDLRLNAPVQRVRAPGRLHDLATSRVNRGMLSVATNWSDHATSEDRNSCSR